MKLIVCETVKQYHLIEVDDEVNIEDVVSRANADSSKFETGCEALEDKLNKLQRTYGVEYRIVPNFCGSEVEDIDIVDEVD